MPILVDLSLGRAEDGVVTVGMTPAIAIGGWTLQCKVERRFGGISGIIIATCASGYNNVSGINITNSGTGVFQVTIPGIITSGLKDGNYAYSVSRTDSGSWTNITQGYISITPSNT